MNDDDARLFEAYERGLARGLEIAGGQAFITETPKLHATSIQVLNPSKRAKNCFARYKINTIGDLMNYTEMDLLDFKNFGDQCLVEIKDKLASIGLHLITMEDLRKEAGLPVCDDVDNLPVAVNGQE